MENNTMKDTSQTYDQIMASKADNSLTESQKMTHLLANVGQTICASVGGGLVGSAFGPLGTIAGVLVPPVLMIGCGVLIGKEAMIASLSGEPYHPAKKSKGASTPGYNEG